MRLDETEEGYDVNLDNETCFEEEIQQQILQEEAERLIEFGLGMEEICDEIDYDVVFKTDAHNPSKIVDNLLVAMKDSDF